MCTAGFWKDISGNVIFFKNRDNDYAHINERYEKFAGGLFICDDNGKFEGMNKYGLFIVELTLKPTEVEKKEKSDTYTKNALLNFQSAKDALEFILKEHKTHAFAASFIIGDLKNIFLLEVVPNRSAFADLSEASYFVQTNHGQLLLNQGASSEYNPTRERFIEAQKLIKEVKSISDIKNMLTHHKGEASICRHKDGEKTYTQGSYIFYPSEKKAEVIIGKYPCSDAYEVVCI